MPVMPKFLVCGDEASSASALVQSGGLLEQLADGYAVVDLDERVLWGNAALRRLAGYSLDPALDRRILLLGERKADLTLAEHDELLAWVAFTQQRSIEKLEAKVALQRLYNVCPELGSSA